jgi:hypothetical protein
VQESTIEIKFITLALVTATVNLFDGHSSPYRCKMSGNELEADIILVDGGAAGCILDLLLNSGFVDFQY